MTTEAIYKTMHCSEPKYQRNNCGLIFLRYWLKYLPELPASLVEIGCGNGKLCNLFTEMGYDDVWGYDIADGPYDRQLYSFRKEDITQVPWKMREDEFDCLLSFDVLEHLREKDIDKVLAEMKRVSKQVILSIACHSPDDVLHLTVRLPQWWHGKLTTLYEGYTDFQLYISKVYEHQTLIFYGRKET